jgi:adenylate cyclase
MVQEGFKRKLAAILSADVIGYSRLMRDDEEATVRDLAAHRVLITEIIQQHNGRVVDSPGDNILAEFGSVVDAVNGAIKIQQEIKRSNTETPVDRLMEFRIGINLGDVIEEGERIYGDGVNIAARVEGLAAGGGIAISGIVYDSIKDKFSLGYHYLGEQDVKNIPEPVRIYRLLTEPADAGKMIGEEKPKSKKLILAASGAIALIILVVGSIAIWNYYFRPSFEPASIEKMAFPLPAEPSIAVLPFDNMSGDPDQEYFSDGITEQIITSLSSAPFLFVIARNSTFAYKNKPLKVQQISEELGVQYILEGSVQRSDDRVRIAAQLIDATKGHHLWAESYDRKITDIFLLYDEITMKIIAELQVKISAADLGRVSSIKTENLKAYEKYLKGYGHYWKRTAEDTIEARKLAQEAIELDPRYGAAYCLLASTYLDDIYFHRTKSRGEFLEKAEKLVQKSIDYSGPDHRTHEILSSIYYLSKQYDKAISEGQKAVEFNPNSANSNFVYGMVLSLATRYDEAILVLKKAIRLNTVTPSNYLNQLAMAYLHTKQYEEAIPLWNQTIERNPDYYYAHMGLTVAYQLTGKGDKARESAAELMRVRPDFSVSMLKKRFISSDKESKERILSALREAGLPE